MLDSPKKIALFIFFASVAVNAALGIVALFAGEFGETQGKVLMTSLSISAASVGSLAMLPARERGLLGNVPNAGIVLIITASTVTNANAARITSLNLSATAARTIKLE